MRIWFPLILSVHPQGLVPIDANFWQDEMCSIHYEWATNISVYICSVTEPAVSCTSQLFVKFWLLQRLYFQVLVCFCMRVPACIRWWLHWCFAQRNRILQLFLATVCIFLYHISKLFSSLDLSVIMVHLRRSVMRWFISTISIIYSSWVYVWLQLGSVAHDIQCKNSCRTVVLC